ncbi:MAG: aspartate aminotransferase [Bacteroidetes bacterium CG18_big_fil_WC_8_21_14_2_50_41_14]|nr:MAG: aspartate aminotransferase [Bacteroidetes bacterium CG18_big_fil_WC_8_21_14_2_50_41_14]PJB59858.1 MAG: aspartate aminotransferase [Bacteroidetes bacterium CG_4_9_14_3_um_filter_41_19]
MTRLSRELQGQGIDIINLSIGEPDFNTPDFVKQGAIEAIHNNITKYPPVPGLAPVREAISKKLKRDNQLEYKPSQIVVSNGAKQSLANVFFCLLNPGDEIVVPAPYWVSYTEMIKLAGGDIKLIEAGIEADFKVTPEQIAAAITPRTKALLINSPSNPTGSVYSFAEMKAIAEVIAKHPDLVVISDEIYEHILFEGSHVSLASFPEIKSQVVIINGVSKGFSMTGWRIGYLAAPQFIADACTKLQGQFTSGAGSISQMAAAAAVSADPNQIPELKIMVAAFKERRDLLVRMMQEIEGVKTNLPKGAFYLFPDVSSFFGKSDGNTLVNDSTQLCTYLLEKAHVALVPGEAFGDPNCIRLSYATSKELLVEAVNRIKTALALLK